MQPEPRAVLFDLDDTLYPLRNFVRSGFAACAVYLDRVVGLDPREVLSVLLAASAGAERGGELRVCAMRYGLSTAMVHALVQVIREHSPLLTLPAASRAALAAMRPGWRLGVVTNGLPDRQARKVSALGLPPMVDTIVYANAVGDGRGKPQPEPFLEAARRLAISPERTLFVGDDLRCDVLGARLVGMRTVHFSPRPDGVVVGGSPFADATISSLHALSAVAETLLPAYRVDDVA
jgi:putative hydrolase of the HAD superfamily